MNRRLLAVSMRFEAMSMNSIPPSDRRKASEGISRSTRPELDSSRKRMPDSGRFTSLGDERKKNEAFCTSRSVTARPAIESGKRPSATSWRA